MTKIASKTLLLLVAMLVALASARRGGGGKNMMKMMMMGGGGGGGVGGMKPRPSRSPVAFVDLNCTSVGGPDCAINREGDAGIWVCHTKMDNSTVSACIDPDFALEGDTCGCCDDTCPEECTCVCTDLDGEDGVLVVVNERTGEERCMPSENAISLVARGKVTCSDTCDDVRE